jgi:hypothetical protein
VPEAFACASMSVMRKDATIRSDLQRPPGPRGSDTCCFPRILVGLAKPGVLNQVASSMETYIRVDSPIRSARDTTTGPDSDFRDNIQLAPLHDLFVDARVPWCFGTFLSFHLALLHVF